MFKNYCFFMMLPLFLVGCESDNEHFCARYHYVYNQLLEENLPTYSEMKQQLMVSLADPSKDHDQANFMLFVLEDWRSQLKAEHEGSREFCIRVKRWQYYP